MLCLAALSTLPPALSPPFPPLVTGMKVWDKEGTGLDVLSTSRAWD